MTTTKEILAQVKQIELRTKKLVDGLIAGNYHSVFKGQGIEFSEIRDYRAGDDVRAIDWKVTARFNHPFVKEFIEERDLHIYFAIDMSASAAFGNNISKKQKALELTASLMFAALRNNDNVGVFLFTDHLEHFIPARKGRRHILKIISTLVSFKPVAKETNLSNALSTITRVVKKRSILFVVSDFFDTSYERPLRFLSKHHDVIGINVHDSRESHLPDVGIIALEDEETGEQILVDTSDQSFREKYAHQMKMRLEHLQKNMHKYNIDLLSVHTEQSYEVPLRAFFNKRKLTH